MQNWTGGSKKRSVASKANKHESKQSKHKDKAEIPGFMKWKHAPKSVDIDVLAMKDEKKRNHRFEFAKDLPEKRKKHSHNRWIDASKPSAAQPLSTTSQSQNATDVSEMTSMLSSIKSELTLLTSKIEQVHRLLLIEKSSEGRTEVDFVPISFEDQ